MWHTNCDLTMVEEEDRVTQIKSCERHVIVDVHDEEGSFSMAPCGACKTRQAGTRVRAWIVDSL
jgi:hypothetical protein